MARTVSNAWVLLGFVLPACLPDTYTSSQIQAHIADAHGIEPADAPTGPVCGNGKVEAGEQCDPGATTCGGCDHCQRRRVLEVNTSSDAVKTPYSDKYVLSDKGNQSYAAWVRLHDVPPVGAQPFLMRFEVLPTKQTYAVLAGLVRGSANVNSVYPFCAVYVWGPGIAQQPAPLLDNVTVNAKNELSLDTWHHVRCLLTNNASKLGISVDGSAVASEKVAFSLPQAKNALAFLAFGAMPSLTGGKPFVGQLDEVQVVADLPGDQQTRVQRRIVDPAGSVALFHLDGVDTDASVQDSAPNAADAAQTTWNGKEFVSQNAPLHFLAEDCYGFGEAGATCKAGTKAPWCP